MAKKHPIVAVTGASGAGTTVVQQAFREIFHRQGLNAAFVHGDSFLKYDHDEICRVMDEAQLNKHPKSCYGPELNYFEKLEGLFREYSEHGTGQVRELLSQDSANGSSGKGGSFTEWHDLPEDTDMLFYEGMHGGVVAETWTRRKMSASHNPRVIRDRREANRSQGVDVAQYVDLLIGVVPAINLEWIQKIHLDMNCRNHSSTEVTQAILGRLQDYIHFIVPQFSLTDINFQRMPVVDTSNPFIARDVPTESESIVVIRFREPKKYDFPHLLKRINGSFMSRRNTMVIPGGEMQHALAVICGPMIESCCGM
ncbi:MAG: phosphoribulokinase [Gammaproteobacteria bacterium]|nr:phosphoribulokinase [Gammaproteobacteria bacterium]